MIVYKKVDKFDRRTGKPAGTETVYDHAICDFTGDRISEHDNPNTYSIDFNDNDPSYGDAEGERWLYDWCEKRGAEVEACDLFAQSEYVFSMKRDGYVEVFHDLMLKAMKELNEIYSLEHLLRWARGKMLERVVKEGKYEIDQFIEY